MHYVLIYFLPIAFAFCSDEEISAITLDAIKRLAEIPKGIVSIIFIHTFLLMWIGDAKIIFCFQDIIFPPDGQGSLQLDKVAAQSSSMV
jgi:26S proteasome non-ATPase regulatory subunit 5